ncbi:hypothetical protein HPB50_018006 [Hyalomma asiaticum]|uniref:Uncharacterized protein n=1 Tax=Hyalomma asiaticum TaxID=266040 RepID=A0ACB7RLK9_HYAAI|nr:hypothetical protein HPB50_018006 [Hyalomma asiaticum]
MAPRLTADERRAIAVMGRTMSQRAICAAAGRPMRIVNRVLQAYYNEGRISDAPRGSRQRVTSEDEDRLIVTAAVAEPYLSAREIRDEVGLGTISVQTVKRRLHEAGISSKISVQKIMLDERHCNERLEFASTVESWRPDKWRAVVFTDEASFCTRWDQQRRVWRPQNCRAEQACMCVRPRKLLCTRRHNRNGRKVSRRKSGPAARALYTYLVAAVHNSCRVWIMHLAT